MLARMKAQPGRVRITWALCTSDPALIMKPLRLGVMILMSTSIRAYPQSSLQWCLTFSLPATQDIFLHFSWYMPWNC